MTEEEMNAFDKNFDSIIDDLKEELKGIEEMMNLLHGYIYRRSRLIDIVNDLKSSLLKG